MADTFTITQSPDSANLYLYPSSDATVAMTPVSESSNYECVDEIWNSPNDNTDYVYTNSTTFESDLYNMDNHGSETGDINYVRIITRASSATWTQSTSGGFYIRCYDGASTASSANKAPITTGYKQYYHTWSTKPSGGAWGWSDIDDLIIGMVANSPIVNNVSTSTVLRPISDGTLIELGNHGADDNWDCVDEVVSDENTTYVQNDGDAGQWDADHYLLSSYGAASGIIQNVRVTASCKCSETGSKIKLGVSDGGIPGKLGAEQNLHLNTYEDETDYWNTDPNNNTWGWDDIDTLEAVVHLYRHQWSPNPYPRCTQLWVTVNYLKDDSPEIRTTQTYAVVNYTPSSTTVTLRTPESLSVGHSRNVQRFQFPSGGYEIEDVGRGEKALSITGFEYSSADDKMQDLKDMCHYGSVVTIAGLPDTNLDGDYLIHDFNFEDESYGDVLKYRWHLNLEESG